MERTDVLVVGAGPAGLATSHELTTAGIEHVVLERARVAQSWRDRWASFCLVTPNWTVQLPGGAYAGDDPDGFIPRDEIVAHMERYASGFGAPVREGVDVTALRPASGGGFEATTSAGPIAARDVVLCTGSFPRQFRPPALSALPADVPIVDLRGYHAPDGLPPGAILVVGSGQSGCQLAEELHDAGRDVVLSCGRAPWSPRRIGDHDTVWWALESGFLDVPLASLPMPGMRLVGNPQTSGHDGGHDLHLRTLRAAGVTLAGHFVGVEGRRARFASDLPATAAWGDDRWRDFSGFVRKTATERGLPMPDLVTPEPITDEGPGSIPLDGLGAVVLAGGFRPDYDWLPWPEAFDGMGFPITVDGTSSIVPDLHFVGVHFLRKRKSSNLLGMGEDATVVAATIASRARRPD